MHSSIEKPATVQFKSEVATKVFDSLVDSFIEDYMVKKYVAEKSGWRTLAEIADRSHVSPSALYGKHSTLGASLDEPISRGLLESRIFPGERGRGGEVMRLRITYEKDPIREYVSERIRLGRKESKVSPEEPTDPFEERIVQVLLEAPLLSSLQKDHLTKIARLSEKPTFPPNEFIVHEGDIASGFFVIIEGQAEVKQRGRTIRRLGRGQFFGETSLAEHESRSADVIAIEPTMCLKISAEHLKELINLDPQIAVKLLQETVKRNRGITKASMTEES